MFSSLGSYIQVFVAAIRNRALPVPEKSEELHEIHDKEVGMENEILARTDQFRYCIRLQIDFRV